MKQTAQELMRAIRGKRSQMNFAKRLGFRSNTPADWEAGRRFPTGLLMLQACARSGIDVHAAMNRFMSSADAAALCTPLNETGLALWLSSLRGKQPIIAIADTMKVSRYSVGRWFSAQSQPRLPEFLSLIQACTHRVADFVDELVGIDLVPSLAQEQRARQILQELAWTVPWTEAIMRVLETTQYHQRCKESACYVAEYLHIDLHIVHESLALLQQANLVSWNGKDHILSDVLTVDTHRLPESFWPLLQHWQQQVQQRVQRDHVGVVNYNVFACSQKDYDYICALQRAHFEQVRGVIAKSTPSETVALLQNNLIPLGPLSDVDL